MIDGWRCRWCGRFRLARTSACSCGADRWLGAPSWLGPELRDWLADWIERATSRRVAAYVVARVRRAEVMARDVRDLAKDKRRRKAARLQAAGVKPAGA